MSFVVVDLRGSFECPLGVLYLSFVGVFVVFMCPLGVSLLSIEDPFVVLWGILWLYKCPL